MSVSCYPEASINNHGIAAAYYSNGPLGLEPVLECLCGESFKEYNWEEAGALLDDHLNLILSVSGDVEEAVREK